MALSFYSRRKIDEPNFSTSTGASVYKAPPKTTLPQQNDYAASGYTTKYASNPTNYNTPQLPQPKPDTQTVSPYAAYLNRSKQLANDQIAMQKKRADEQAGFINENDQAQRSILEGKRTRLTDNANKYRDVINSNISTEEERANQAVVDSDTEYDEALRRSAEANRDSQGQIQNIFAGLNTLDSSAFQKSMMNRQAKFSGEQQQTLREKARSATEIKAELQRYKSDAARKILDVEASLQNELDAIDATMAEGSLAKKQAIAQLYSQAEDYITSIEQGMMNLENEMAMSTYEADLTSSNKNASLTEKQRSFLGAAEVAMGALNKLKAGSVQSGIGQGIIGKWGEKAGWNSSDQQAYRNDIAIARTAARNALLGANMSPAEMESLMAAIPDYDDAPEIAKQKLESFIYNMNILANPGQQTSGMASYSYNENNDPLGIL